MLVVILIAEALDLVSEILPLLLKYSTSFDVFPKSNVSSQTPSFKNEIFVGS